MYNPMTTSVVVDDADNLRSMTFTIGENPEIQVTVTEQNDGSLLVDLDTNEDSTIIGDISGLFFDVADESLLNGLSVTGEDVTGSKFGANAVSNLGKGVNMHGAGEPGDGPFDAGVKFGSPGKSADDIQETSFTLSHDDFALTLEDLSEMDFGVRLTSVGPQDGPREGSLKLIDQAPVVQDLPDEDTPNIPENNNTAVPVDDLSDDNNTENESQPDDLTGETGGQPDGGNGEVPPSTSGSIADYIPVLDLPQDQDNTPDTDIVADDGLIPEDALGYF